MIACLGRSAVKRVLNTVARVPVFDWQQGMKWLSRILYPMVAVWAVYSLMTNPHKGWWSWLISSLANGT